MPTASSIRIDPEAIFDDAAVYALLDVSAATLNRARRLNKLRYTRQGRRILYLGRWLLDWLEADATPRRAHEGQHGE